MEDNLHAYVEFFLAEGVSVSIAEEKLQLAKDSIDKMRSSGIWDTVANDMMPLALANYTQRRVKIFTSRRNQAVFDITPSMTTCSIFNPIYFCSADAKGRTRTL